jgi:putative hydrolase of HD superfamily
VTESISDDALFSLADEMEILQRLERTGYVMSGVTNPQTVGSHAFGVTLWCLFLIERIEDKQSIDTAKVLRMAVIHEMGEARIADIPMPARQYLGDEPLSQAESRAVQNMVKDFPDHWYDTWHEFETGETREARIVKAADKLELMHKILCYERAHNGNFEKFWANDNNFRWAGIEEAKEIFEEMKRRHRDA